MAKAALAHPALAARPLAAAPARRATATAELTVTAGQTASVPSALVPARHRQHIQQCAVIVQWVSGCTVVQVSLTKILTATHVSLRPA